MGFRIFGTPQDIEGSAANLEGALDPDGLNKKRGIQGGTMSRAVQDVSTKKLEEEERMDLENPHA